MTTSILRNLLLCAFMSAATWSCVGEPRLPAHITRTDSGFFDDDVADEQIPARRLRPTIFSDAGTGKLLGLSVGHTLVSGSASGDDWARVIDAAHSHVPLIALAPGSSLGHMVCAQTSERYPVADYCRQAGDDAWRRLNGAADASHEAYHAIAVGATGGRDAWVLGEAGPHLTNGPRLSTELHMPAPHQRLAASQDLGTSWEEHPMGWQPHVRAYAAAPGVVIGTVSDAGRRADYQYCEAPWHCQPVPMRDPGLLAAYLPTVPGRAAYDLGFPINACAVYANRAAPPLLISARDERCGKLFLLEDASHGFIAARQQGDEVALWREEPHVDAVRYVVPEAGCVLHVTRQGLMTCAGTAALYVSYDLGREWSVTCRAGTCPLYDASAVQEK